MFLIIQNKALLLFYLFAMCCVGIYSQILGLI